MISKKHLDVLNKSGLNEYADYIKTLEATIVEQGKKAKKLKKANKFLTKSLRFLNKEESRNKTLEAIMNIEQRAKGVDDYISTLDGNCQIKVYNSHIIKDGAMYSDSLRQQASKLRYEFTKCCKPKG